VGVVVQVPLFEAWLTADPAGLLAVPGVHESQCQHDHNNVDSDIVRHDVWLKMAVPGYVKRPANAIRIVSCLHPERMAMRSRSFRKCWKEVGLAYEQWAELNNRVVFRVPYQLAAD
jgi:hypothetical protein